MMYPSSALIMLSYFDLRILSAAFLRPVPKRLGGILTISTSVETENNCNFFLGFEFMSLWVKFAIFLKELGFLHFDCQKYRNPRLQFSISLD